MPKQLSISELNSEADPKEHTSTSPSEIREILAKALNMMEGKCVFLFGDCGGFDDHRKFPLYRAFVHEDASEILRFYDVFETSSNYENNNGENTAYYYLQMYESWESACSVLQMLSEGSTDKCYDEEREHQEPEDVINTKNLSLAIYKSMVKYAKDGRLEDQCILYWPKQSIYTYQDRVVGHDVFWHMKENGLLKHWKTARSWNGQDVPMYQPTIIRIAK